MRYVSKELICKRKMNVNIAELVIVRDVPTVSKRITIASGMIVLPP